DSGGNEGKQGREGEGKPASGAKHEGVTFKGPQYIRSDFPDPDNNLQTILQPALTKPLKLDFPIQVPNTIHVARPKPQNVTPPKVQVKTALKDVPLPTPTEKPVLKAEAQLISTPLHSEALPLLPLPEMQPVAKDPAPQQTIVVTPEEKREPPPVITADASMAEQSLAVLNAVHINAPHLVIPPGEKHASFEVSPNGTATAHAGGTHAGLPGGKPTAGSGEGSGTAKAGSGGGGSGSGKAGSGAGRSGSGSGSGGTGSGPGAGSVGTGSGRTGRGGNGAGRGNGTGKGNGSGSGSGSGSGPGNGPFPGIQVIGGEGSGMVGAARPPRPDPPPHNYDFSIVASGGSGGGLKDFGVFHRNEAVYTVYIDVSDIAPTSEAWVLQYADTGAGPRTAEITLGNDGSLSAPQAMLEPPYALVKKLPEKLDSPPNSAMTVVTGIISREGKLEGARVLQAPNEACGKQWADALGNWTFRPASKGGQPVPVRVLIGIPVY
ncbi:MAG: hypothetical protein ROO76_00335, partial [Terriglobia bacterium]|nr:hypothetical protein [Terriglobia bacterium]